MALNIFLCGLLSPPEPRLKDPPGKSREPAVCAAKGLTIAAPNPAELVGFENPPKNGCPVAPGGSVWAPNTKELRPAFDCAPNPDGWGETLPPICDGSSAMLLSSILGWSITTTSFSIVPFVVEPKAGTELDKPKIGEGGAPLLAANGKDPAKPNVNALPEEFAALEPNEKVGEEAPKEKAELVEGDGDVKPEPNKGVDGDSETGTDAKPPKTGLALVELNAGVVAVDPKAKGARADAGAKPKVLPLDTVPNTELGNDGNDGVLPNPAEDETDEVIPADVAGEQNGNAGIPADEGNADAVCDAELEACTNE